MAFITKARVSNMSIWTSYNHILFTSSTAVATSGTGIAYPSGASEFLSEVLVAQSLVFSVVLCRPLFITYLLAIILFVLLRMTASI